ncbi:MAG: hypothetical protein QG657_4797 [Acidobacteriota bacterium]|nr:hypothetical protein [Acidobacteriota bacterium]
MKTTIILPLLLVLIVSTNLPANAQDEFPRGEIIEKVICKDKPDQSYVLYLPTTYSRNKEWPILFAFDPGAVGKRPVELFKPAAEKFGYIVVGSNNSKNGPYYIADQAIFAMWKDTRQRFSVDSHRIYATGFSGGARVASRFHLKTGNACAGIIACGAGVPEDFGDLGTLKPAAWYGIVGLSDFNYFELLGLETAFDHTSIIHQVDVIDAEHRWPPEEAVTRAVAWMEINAMKNNTRTKDDSLAQAIYQETLTRANNLELSGNIPFAVGAYDWAKRLFNGLLDTSFAEKKKNQLSESKAYKKFLEDENVRSQKTSYYIKNLGRVFNLIENSQKKQVSLDEIFQELQLPDLQKQAKKKKDIFNSGFAFRVMAGLSNTIYGKGSEYYRSADYGKAILCFGVSAYVEERTYYSAYNLACAYSLNKQAKPAIKALELAVKRGLNNPAQLDNDKDLDFIRNEKGYKEIRQKMGQGKSQ